MQTAAGHNADLWLRRSTYTMVEFLTRHSTVASPAVLTDKYCTTYLNDCFPHLVCIFCRERLLLYFLVTLFLPLSV